MLEDGDPWKHVASINNKVFVLISIGFGVGVLERTGIGVGGGGGSLEAWGILHGVPGAGRGCPQKNGVAITRLVDAWC